MGKNRKKRARKGHQPRVNTPGTMMDRARDNPLPAPQSAMDFDTSVEMEVARGSPVTERARLQTMDSATSVDQEAARDSPVTERARLQTMGSATSVDTKVARGNPLTERAWQLSKETMATSIPMHSEFDDQVFFAIELQGLAPGMKKEHLELLLESLTEDDGASIATIKYLPEEHRAWIRLSRAEVARHVVMRSPLDVDGTPVDVVPLNTMLEDDPDYQGSAAIRVTNMPPNASQQYIQMFFTNQRRSSGGPIEDIYHCHSTGATFITFKEAVVAKRVLQRHDEKPLEFMNCELDIRPMEARPPPPLCLGPRECDRLLVTSLPEHVTETDLKRFLGSACDVKEVRFSCRSGVALVVFDDFPDYEVLLQWCGTNPLQGSMVSIQEIPLPRHIQVHGVEGISKDIIELYFDNEMDADNGHAVLCPDVSEDKSWVVIRLNDPNSIKRMVGKSHTLEGRTLKVDVYYPAFGEVPPDVDVTVPVHERVASVILPCDGRVRRFVSGSPQAIACLNDRLKSADVVIQPGGGGSEGELTLVSTATGTTADMTGWKSRTESLLAKALGEIFDDRRMELPAELFSNMPDEVKDHERDGRVRIDVNDDDRSISFVGWKEEVSALEALLSSKREELEDGRDAQQVKVDLKKHEAMILKVSKFSEEMKKKFPKLKLRIGNADISLEGHIRHVTDAKLIMYEQYTMKITTRVEQVPPDVLELLRLKKTAQYVNAELEDVGICVAWEVSDEKLTLVALSEDDLDSTIAILKASICHTKRKLVSAEADALKSSDWVDFMLAEKKRHSGLLLITFQGDQLTWTCVKDISEEIRKKMTSFLDDFAVHEKLVPADPGVVEVLEQYGDLRAVAKETKAIVEALWEDVDKAGFVLRGPRADIEAAREKISALASTVIHRDHVLDKSQEARFILSQKGGLALENMRIRNKCAITVVREDEDGEREDTPDEDEAGARWMATRRPGAVESPTEAPRRPTVPQVFPNTTRRITHVSSRSGSCDFTTKWGMTISQKTGSIETEQVHAIVNTTTRDLKLNSGRVSSVISQAAGPSVQAECHQLAPRGLKQDEVVMTSGGNLPAQHIIHGAAIQWDGGSGQSEKVLRTLVLKCLAEADKKRLTSIAFPAIGTGNLNMPRDVAAKAMYEEMVTFSQRHPTTTVKDVRIVLHHSDQKTIKAFATEVQKSYTSGAVQAAGDFQRLPRTMDILTKNNITISQRTSSIETENVDVVVNTTTSQLSLNSGGVSSVISNAAGPSVQAECKQLAPRGLKQDEVVMTSGGNLPARHIIHGAAMQWDGGSGQSEKVLRTLVLTCLTEADNKGLTSIAFPAIGTGNLGMPRDVVAKAMYEEMVTFSQGHPTTTVKDVRIVLHHSDQETIKAFAAHLESIGKVSIAPRRNRQLVTGSAASSSQPQGTSSQAATHTAKGLPCDFKNGKLTITIHGSTLQVYGGDLMKEKTDAIVNSIDETLDLSRGVVAQTILAVGGATIQEECYNNIEEAENGVVLTKAGSLQCKHILHLVYGHVALQKLIRRGLKELESKRQTSVSFPVLGTGTMTMSPTRFAKDFFAAVTDFVKKDRPKYIRDIRLVVFQPDMVAVVQQELKTLAQTKKKNIFGRVADFILGVSTEEGEEEGTGDRGATRRESQEPRAGSRGGCRVTLRMHALSNHNLDRVIKQLTQHIEASTRTETIGSEEDQVALSNLTEDLRLRIYGVSERYFVDVVFGDDGPRKQLKVTGNHDEMMLAINEISKILQTAERKYREAKDLERVLDQFRWEYSDDGETFSPYSPEINLVIEKAHQDGKKFAEWEEPQGKYRISFSRKEEETVGGAGSPVRVRRFDKLETRLLPSHWTTDTTGVRKVRLSPSSPEYQKAEQQFLSTGGPATIQQIERIENPTLYKQYEVHKERMEAVNPTGHQNEHVLYHGTSADTLDTINRNGFDRSFTGKNATAYGEGVYFAVNASYSTRYSTANPNGIKFMYQCKVLTGEYCQGASGLRKPPQKQGSSTGVLYDSAVDRLRNPGIYVIFNDNQAYPEYLIQFT